MATRSPAGLGNAVTIASNNSPNWPRLPNTPRFCFKITAQVSVECYCTIFPEMGDSIAGLPYINVLAAASSLRMYTLQCRQKQILQQTISSTLALNLQQRACRQREAASLLPHLSEIARKKCTSVLQWSYAADDVA